MKKELLMQLKVKVPNPAFPSSWLCLLSELSQKEKRKEKNLKKE